jgi:hypothetical protein
MRTRVTRRAGHDDQSGQINQIGNAVTRLPRYSGVSGRLDARSSHGVQRAGMRPMTECRLARLPLTAGIWINPRDRSMNYRLKVEGRPGRMPNPGSGRPH